MRIKPEEVWEAYQETNMIPAPKDFVRRKNDRVIGCAIGALYVKETCNLDATWDDVFDWAAERFKSSDYVEGFYTGFDCGATALGLHDVPDMSDEYLIGINDGYAAHKRIVAEGFEL